MSLRVTRGASSASPPATTRTAWIRSAGSESFTRNPLAPPRIAWYTYSSDSNVVSMITFTPARSSSAAIRRVASSPSTPGIRMSMSTTSARSCRAWSTASAPLAASPTTSIPSALSSSTRKPARISA